MCLVSNGVLFKPIRFSKPYRFGYQLKKDCLNVINIMKRFVEWYRSLGKSTFGTGAVPCYKIKLIFIKIFCYLGYQFII